MYQILVIALYTGLVLTVITRGVRRDRHSPAQDRHSLPVPHPTSEHAQLLSNRPISVANPLSVPKEDLDLPPIDLSSIDLSEVQVIKVGFLSKTTQWQGDGASKRGEITQKRRFRLTEDAFEYFQHFSWNVSSKFFASLTNEKKSTIATIQHLVLIFHINMAGESKA